MIEGLDTTAERVNCLVNVLIARATGGSWDDEVYQLVRHELIRDAKLKPLTPEFVRTCRSEDQFWQFIKRKFNTYAERRTFIWEEFSRIRDALDGESSAPSDAPVSESVEKLDAAHVQELWQKALARRESDPEGALTSARSLIESVCKLILDDANVPYDRNADLPKLYKLVAKELNLAPSQHTETVFKQILGGCTAVVEGLGSVRSRLGDAHGRGAQPVKPAPRHAGLAVNLAGSMAMFLIQTWEAKTCRTDGYQL